MLCGTSLPKGTVAKFDRTTRTIRCEVCPTALADAESPPVDVGVAGASARREEQRRRTKREAETKRRFGNHLGGALLAVAGERQSTRAWGRGAEGEERLAAALADLAEVVVLHDRRVPGTRGNIDHIVIARSGVFVVDAKFWKGTIKIRHRGRLFRSDKRLYVGSRDGSDLADKMGWQVEAVSRALEVAGLPDAVVTPVLCFVKGEWPLLFPPDSYRGVRLEGLGSLRKLVSSTGVLDRDRIDRVSRALAAALPPK